MSIVHLVSRPAAGGIRTHLVGLLEDLPHNGWEPLLHAPKSLISSLSTPFPDLSATELDVHPSVSITDFSTAKQLASQVTSGSIVHAHGIRAAWIAALAKQFISFSLIVTLHNVPPGGSLSSLALKIIASRSSRIVCVSQYIADRVNSDRTITIPNGVLCPSGTVRPTNHRFTVLCASRLAPEKGIDILIEAAWHLPNILFVVAGSGALHEALAAKAPSNVTFLGQRSDISQLVSTADCVVQPSRTEGQGLSVLEAFAGGTPVIATAVGGVPENVTNGVTGILIERDDAKALASAIEDLRLNPEKANEMAKAASAWVRENRRRENQSTLIADLYLDVMRIDKL